MNKRLPESGRLVSVVLDGQVLTRRSPAIEADRAQAVSDIVVENRFFPRGRGSGPFILHLSIQERRLVFDIHDATDHPLVAVVIALSSFRRLIKDYELLVDSHMLAVEEGREARIQAIDMGRRGLHNEGAELLRARLAGNIEIDFPTARRLFTLICVLHQRP